MGQDVFLSQIQEDIASTENPMDGPLMFSWTLTLGKFSPTRLSDLTFVFNPVNYHESKDLRLRDSSFPFV
jgi:hypothetical protein